MSGGEDLTEVEYHRRLISA